MTLCLQSVLWPAGLWIGDCQHGIHPQHSSRLSSSGFPVRRPHGLQYTKKSKMSTMPPGQTSSHPQQSWPVNLPRADTKNQYDMRVYNRLVINLPPEPWIGICQQGIHSQHSFRPLSSLGFPVHVRGCSSYKHDISETCLRGLGSAFARRSLPYRACLSRAGLAINTVTGIE